MSDKANLQRFWNIYFQVILEKVVPRIKNVLDGVKDSAPVTVYMEDLLFDVFQIHPSYQALFTLMSTLMPPPRQS